MEWIKSFLQKYSRRDRKKEDESNPYLSSIKPDRDF